MAKARRNLTDKAKMLKETTKKLGTIFGKSAYKQLWKTDKWFMIVNHARYVPQLAFWAVVGVFAKETATKKQTEMFNRIAAREDIQKKLMSAKNTRQMLYSWFPPKKQ